MDHPLHRPSRRRFNQILLAGAGGFAGPVLAQASAWPRQPLKIVVGYPAGTSTDMAARAIVEPLSRALGTTVIVENKPGSGGNIGLDLVARAVDGHTIGFTTQGPLTTAPTLYKSLPYDVDRDLRMLSLVAASPQILIVPATLGVNSLQELLRHARSRKEGLSYGSIGIGSGSHLTAELLAAETGVPLVHIPYQGFPQVTSAILAEQIQMAFMAPSGALAQARAGKVRILGITSPQPSALAPGVPTIAEAARLPNFRAELWMAACAPRSMPEAIASRLSAEINAALSSPAVRAQLGAQGWEVVAGDAEEAQRRIKADTAMWGGIIRRANVRLE